MAEHEVPDLHDVEEKIHAAHDAEDKLLHTMPNAIHPDDNAFPGMVPPSAPRQRPRRTPRNSPSLTTAPAAKRRMTTRRRSSSRPSSRTTAHRRTTPTTADARGGYSPRRLRACSALRRSWL